MISTLAQIYRAMLCLCNIQSLAKKKAQFRRFSSIPLPLMGWGAPPALDLDQGRTRSISSLLRKIIISGMSVKHDAEDAKKFVLAWSNFWMNYDRTLAGGLECVGWQDVMTTLFGSRIRGLNPADTKQASGLRAG